MFKLDLEKAEEPEIKLPTSAGVQKKQENSRPPLISPLLSTVLGSGEAQQTEMLPSLAGVEAAHEWEQRTSGLASLPLASYIGKVLQG